MDLAGIVQNITDWCGDAFSAVANNLDAVAFVVLMIMGIWAAILVVTSDEVMHSAFYLALVFTLVAATYYFLNAELVGVIQMMVYVGAITILFSFSVMLTRRTIKGADEEKLEEEEKE